MRSISNYINEGVYRNLGIDSAIYESDLKLFKSMLPKEELLEDPKCQGGVLTAVTDSRTQWMTFIISRSREKFDIIEEVHCHFKNNDRVRGYKFIIEPRVDIPAFILDKFVFPKNTEVFLLVNGDITLNKDFLDVATFEDGMPSLTISSNCHPGQVVILDMSSITTPINKLTLSGDIKPIFNKNLKIKELLLGYNTCEPKICITSLPHVDHLVIDNNTGDAITPGKDIVRKFCKYKDGDVKKISFQGKFQNVYKQELTDKIMGK